MVADNKKRPTENQRSKKKGYQLASINNQRCHDLERKKDQFLDVTERR
jgi:hypothetical protein